MNLLILGAGGMAGHVAAIRLAELGHTVTGFARRKLPFCETVTGDAMSVDWPEVARPYDAVLNGIGVLNKAVDAVPHKGVWLNAYLPRWLAEHAKRVIHISSDCVFSGHDGGGYAEDSVRSSDTMYGRTKALGELNDDRNLTIRTSIVGPDRNENGVGLFNWFMKQNGTVSGYTRAIWSGVTTIVLAEAIHAALEQNLTGLYHLTNGEKISKLELLKLFNKLRKTPLEINSSDEIAEDRSLVCTRKGFDFTVPPYAEMVKGLGEWMSRHPGIYPQYSERIILNEKH